MSRKGNTPQYILEMIQDYGLKKMQQAIDAPNWQNVQAWIKHQRVPDHWVIKVSNILNVKPGEVRPDLAELYKHAS